MSILTITRSIFMNCQSVERLKKDRKETLHYRRKLLQKGKNAIAARMMKKITRMDQHIADMQQVINS